VKLLVHVTARESEATSMVPPPPLIATERLVFPSTMTLV
jgi:hypothetical protein